MSQLDWEYRVPVVVVGDIYHKIYAFPIELLAVDHDVHSAREE